MKIYTKFGDKGKTMVVGGVTDKDDARVIAYGEVDELNAVLGVLSTFIEGTELKDLLTDLQRDLFSQWL